MGLYVYTCKFPLAPHVPKPGYQSRQASTSPVSRWSALSNQNLEKIYPLFCSKNAPGHTHLWIGSITDMVLKLVLLALLVQHASAKAFPDTCSCPRAIPCDVNCDPSKCASMPDETCSSGKTNGFCNGEGHDDCPFSVEFNRAYVKTMDSWSCNGGGGYKRMYKCSLLCSGILSGNCDQCNEGFYGAGNECLSCAAGTYCTGGTNQGLCSAGYFCDAESNSATEYQCPAGTYGAPNGNQAQRSSSACSGSCDPGHWCSAGSTSKTQNECRAGRWGASGQINEECTADCKARVVVRGQEAQPRR